MIVVLSGTNRPGANTRKVADLAQGILRTCGEEVAVLDLAELPQEIFSPTCYAAKPASFAPFQQTILEARGILVVTPEYNGSFPGVLKYFVDMLKFPESLFELPVGLVGVAAGRWGALRSVEQLELIFQYRNAHVYGRRVFLPGINDLLGENGRISDPDLKDLFQTMVTGFAEFCRRLGEE